MADVPLVGRRPTIKMEFQSNGQVQTRFDWFGVPMRVAVLHVFRNGAILAAFEPDLKQEKADAVQ